MLGPCFFFFFFLSFKGGDHHFVIMLLRDYSWSQWLYWLQCLIYSALEPDLLSHLMTPVGMDDSIYCSTRVLPGQDVWREFSVQPQSLHPFKHLLHNYPTVSTPTPIPIMKVLLYSSPRDSWKIVRERREGCREKQIICRSLLSVDNIGQRESQLYRQGILKLLQQGQMSLSLLQCGALLPGLNAVVVEVGLSQLKALSYFGSTRLQQTLALWTLVLCLLRQPPFWAFQKYVFWTSLPFLSEEKHERLETWFRGLFFLRRCMYKSIVLHSSSDTLLFRNSTW